MNNAEHEGFEPLTDMQLDQTTVLAELGLEFDDITVPVDVDPDSLVSDSDAKMKLNRCIAIARFKVAQTAFYQARSGRSVFSTILWLKINAHWSEPRPIRKNSLIKKNITFGTKVSHNGKLTSSQTEY